MDVLTTEEYAKKLGIDPSRVRRLCEAGRIPGAKKIGRDWIIPENAVPVAASRGPRPKWLPPSLGEANTQRNEHFVE